MNPKIVFHDLKIEIVLKTGFVTRYYGELMYVVYKKLHCTLYFDDKEKYTVESTLKDMENNLPETTFVKCSRNAIVNLCHCKGYDKTISEIRMDDGGVFTLSKRNKTDFNMKRKNLRCISAFSNTEYENRPFFFRKKNIEKTMDNMGENTPFEKFLSFIHSK